MLKPQTSKEKPLGKVFNELTKAYVSTFSKRLQHLPIKRHYYPLLLINEAKGSLSQTCLAAHLLMDKVGVVRLVNYLSNNNLVARTTNPADRREQLLSCTSKGKALIPEINKALANTNELCLNGLSSQETQLLQKLLAKISCNLHEQPQDSYAINFIKTKQ